MKSKEVKGCLLHILSCPYWACIGPTQTGGLQLTLCVKYDHLALMCGFIFSPHRPE